jgi:hypothetical protein
MKTIFALLISISLFVGPKLKAQEAIKMIECFSPSLSELYTLLDSELVIYGSLIKKDGPFSLYKIEAILQQKGKWFEFGDTVSIFLDDLSLQSYGLKTPSHKTARLALSIGEKNWELKPGSGYSFKPIGEQQKINMLDKVIELPKGLDKSAKILTDFLATYQVEFSERISASCQVKKDSLSLLKKSNPLVALFEKQKREFISELEVISEDAEEPISTSPNTIDSQPHKILNPQLQDSSKAIIDLLTISKFIPKEGSYSSQRVRVIVKVFIDEQGKVYQTELLKGLRRDYDKYALDQALNSGPWVPFRSQGLVQKGFFNLPFNFIRQNEN